MKTITKFEDKLIDAENIKTKLYDLKVGEQLKITTSKCSRIYERVL